MNQMKGTRGTEPDESTSGDASAAAHRGAAAAAAPPARARIFTPHDFYRWADETRVAQYLTSAAIAAMKKAGLVPAWNAADAIGCKLADMADEGQPRQIMVETVEYWVNAAGTDDDNGGWLATPA